MQETGSYAARSREDDIDLVELAKALWSQKLIILAATIAGAAIALVYALLSTPVFTAKATVVPPLLSDIAAYNAGRTASSLYTSSSDEKENRSDEALKLFTTEEVYAVFTRNLQSQSLRRDFFNEVYLPSLSKAERAEPKDRLWENFNKLITITTPDKQRAESMKVSVNQNTPELFEVSVDQNTPEIFEVSVDQNTPELAAGWTNELINRAATASERDMQRNVASELNTRIHSIERRIASLRSTAQQRREDRIATLREALVVAQEVGMNSPQVIAGRTSSSEQLSKCIDGSLTYMRGAKAIEAEMKVLEARQSDDPFIPELRSLQEQRSFLKTIDVRPDNVSVFTLDSAAEVPETPIKPKKTLIVALGLVLGGMIGVFIALVRVMMRRGK